MIYQKKLITLFFKTKTGNEPVRDWIKKLEKEDKKIIGEDIKAVEFGWPLGLPVVRSLGEKLWEIRSQLSTNKIARILFCAEDGYMILLHAFIKKTQKTPIEDIRLARIRMREKCENKK
jgi:phage-related protein